MLFPESESYLFPVQRYVVFGAGLSRLFFLTNMYHEYFSVNKTHIWVFNQQPPMRWKDLFFHCSSNT